jgi:transposase InsO family protein
MDVHHNARTTPHGRRLMIRRLALGWTVAAVAAACGVTVRTGRKWRDRHAAQGDAGLADRASRPRRSPSRLGDAAEIEALRRRRLSGPQIARRLGRPVSTVGLVLRRRGLGRPAALEPKPPTLRYERRRPGEPIHLDIKKLARIDGIGHRLSGDRRGRKRGVGRDFLHVCIDDASRPAFSRILPDERKASAVAFLQQALAWHARLGVKVERVMTDNRRPWAVDPIRRAGAAPGPRRGSAYRSHAFREACQKAALKHKRTRPSTPQTNGLETASPFLPPGDRPRPMAERLIQTSLREWAHHQAFTSPAERARAMRPWRHACNHHRPHSTRKGQPPTSRPAKDNLLENDS